MPIKRNNNPPGRSRIFKLPLVSSPACPRVRCTCGVQYIPWVYYGVAILRFFFELTCTAHCTPRVVLSCTTHTTPPRCLSGPCNTDSAHRSSRGNKWLFLANLRVTLLPRAKNVVSKHYSIPSQGPGTNKRYFIQALSSMNVLLINTQGEEGGEKDLVK